LKNVSLFSKSPTRFAFYPKRVSALSSRQFGAAYYEVTFGLIRLFSLLKFVGGDDI